MSNAFVALYEYTTFEDGCYGVVTSHHFTCGMQSRMTSEPQPESRDHVICERQGFFGGAPAAGCTILRLLSSFSGSSR